MADSSSMGAEVRLRWDIRPGDIGAVVSLHGVLYATEYGFDSTFEGYVAGTLGHFGAPIDSLRERLWLAEVADRVVGSIAIIKHAERMAQAALVPGRSRASGPGDRQETGTRSSPVCQGSGLWRGVPGDAEGTHNRSRAVPRRGV